MHAPPRLKIYFDGGCRPNPGPIETAVVARGMGHFRDDLGDGDSNDAEWYALIEALRLGIASDRAFDLIGDSRHVIDRANGVAPCRSASTRAHRDRFLALAAAHPPTRIRWVRRGQNLAGIALARRRDAHRTAP